MKRILLLLIIGMSTNLIFAQDVIVQQNGDEIQSKIIEITIDIIKYKEYGFQDGPTRNINISEVFMIIYENGKREVFSTIKNKTHKPKDKTSKSNYKGKYFMLATGYGNSYGGLGIRSQARFGSIIGFGIHAGLGYLPSGDIAMVSGGLKFFAYKGLYINTQFGLTGYEESYSYYHHYQDENVVFGPSFLIGGDWVWGSKTAYGFNAALGFSRNLNNTYMDDVTLAIDLGFVIRF
jgi:hypothetical protein